MSSYFSCITDGHNYPFHVLDDMLLGTNEADRDEMR
jgi:hypothetical protein